MYYEHAEPDEWSSAESPLIYLGEEEAAVEEEKEIHYNVKIFTMIVIVNRFVLCFILCTCLGQLQVILSLSGIVHLSLSLSLSLSSPWPSST